MISIFICSSPADENANWVAHELDQHYQVFYEPWDVGVGHNRVSVIDQAIKDCTVTVAVISPQFLLAMNQDSTWTATFDRYQRGRTEGFIPVLFQEIEIDGLLGPLEPLRLYKVDEQDAIQALRDVVEGRSRRPEGPVPYPGATEPYWQALSQPARVRWRDQLDREVTRREPPTLEVHLVPTTDEVPRFSVLDLEKSAEVLAERGRSSGMFSAGSLLTSHFDDAACVVVEHADDVTRGLAVTRDGQRSAWTHLSRRDRAWVLDRDDVTVQVRSLTALLTTLPGRHASRAAPAVGIEPAPLVAVLTDDGPQYSRVRPPPQHVRPPVVDMLTWQWLVNAPDEISAELALRLIAEFSRRTGRRP